MELYAPGVPSSAPGQAIQLPNPRPYATHSRAVLTRIFNSASGKVVGQQIRLGWWHMQRPSRKESSQKCVGAYSLQQSRCLEASSYIYIIPDSAKNGTPSDVYIPGLGLDSIRAHLWCFALDLAAALPSWSYIL